MYFIALRIVTVLASCGGKITEADLLRSHKMKLRFLALLLFYPLSSFATISEKEPASEYFKSPDRISCQRPSLVVFNHEDNYQSLNKGTYGETQLKRTIIKFASIRGNMDLYKNDNESNQGYDFVLVDHGNQLITFLEAKSSDLNTMLGRRPSTPNQEKYGDLLLSPEKQASRDIIKAQLQSHLEIKRKDCDQLSRKWCYKSFAKAVKLDYSSKKDFTKHSPSLNFKAFIEELIEEQQYKFMRLASLTIVDNKEKTNNSPITTPTYYAIIQDADSKISASDIEKKDRIVNASLEFLKDDQEFSLPQAKVYLRQIYDALFSHKYPIQIIDDIPSAYVPLPLLSTDVTVVNKMKPIAKKEKITIEKKNDVKAPKAKIDMPSSPTLVKGKSLRITIKRKSDDANANKMPSQQEEREKKKRKGNEVIFDSKEPIRENNSNYNTEEPEKSLASSAKEMGFCLGNLKDEMEISRFIIAKIHWGNVASAQEIVDSLGVSKSPYYSIRKKGNAPKIVSAVKLYLKNKNSAFYKFALQSLQEEKSTKPSATKISNRNAKESGTSLVSLTKRIGFDIESLKDENKIAKFMLRELCDYSDSSSEEGSDSSSTETDSDSSSIEEDSDSRDDDYFEALKFKIMDGLGVSESALNFFLEEDFGSPMMVSAIKSALADKDSVFYKLVKKFSRNEELLTKKEIKAFLDKSSSSDSDDEYLAPIANQVGFKIDLHNKKYDDDTKVAKFILEKMNGKERSQDLADCLGIPISTLEKFLSGKPKSGLVVSTIKDNLKDEKSAFYKLAKDITPKKG